MSASELLVAPLPARRIVRAWWPLAASWLLMAAEVPAVSAVMARLAHPEINLAAYGGVVFPLALFIEAPIVMLLAASTALSRDRNSFLRLRSFMMWASALLTVWHALLAFTPLYYLLIVRVMNPPAEVVEPARLGLMIMLPWTWAIAYRRFYQGVLIRFDHSRLVGQGTLIRFLTVSTVLVAGYLSRSLSGIAVGTLAIIAGVTIEAAYIGWKSRPVVRASLDLAPQAEPVLTHRAFVNFYLPLAMTALITLGAQPLNSIFLSRMPLALESLAIWPVITGAVFVLQSMCIALTEVVVALLDKPGAAAGLRRFTVLLMSITTGLVLLLAVTPLAGLWFGGVAALAPGLAGMARTGLWLALPMPALAALQAWFQGVLLHTRRTRAITESVCLSMAVSLLLLAGGVALGRFTGLYVGLVATTAGLASQAAWLGWRARRALREVHTHAPLGLAHPVAAAGD